MVCSVCLLVLFLGLNFSTCSDWTATARWPGRRQPLHPARFDYRRSRTGTPGEPCPSWSDSSQSRCGRLHESVGNTIRRYQPIWLLVQLGSYLAQHENVAGSARTVTEGNGQHKDAHQYANSTIAKQSYWRYDTARARTRETNRLDDRDQGLKEEDEEEHHKVEAGIALERLVRWTVPGT